MSDFFALWIPNPKNNGGPFFGVDRSPPEPAPEGCCRRWPVEHDSNPSAAFGHGPTCATAAEEAEL